VQAVPVQTALLLSCAGFENSSHTTGYSRQGGVLYFLVPSRGGDLGRTAGDRPLKYLGGGTEEMLLHPQCLVNGNLQIAIVKEFKKGRNRRYDTM